jgi:hypothetical protein
MPSSSAASPRRFGCSQPTATLALVATSTASAVPS